ncbi:MAG: hypothetical protein IJ939_06295, partial [Clostridia bacterium]|nr:hypothetical protein [Clostridia bacterium]
YRILVPSATLKTVKNIIAASARQVAPFGSLFFACSVSLFLPYSAVLDFAATNCATPRNI